MNKLKVAMIILVLLMGISLRNTVINAQHDQVVHLQGQCVIIDNVKNCM